MAKKQSAAEREGFQVVTDQELLAGVENRARQLELELAGARAMIEETKADPTDNAGTDHFDERITSLEARLKVVYGRRDSLKAGIKQGTPETAEASDAS